MKPGASPNHFVTATGTIPSVRSASCSVSPTQTTRVGAFSTVVSPNLCWMVAGKAASSPPPAAPPPVSLAPSGSSEPQATRAGATAITDRPARKVRRVGLIGSSFGGSGGSPEMAAGQEGKARGAVPSAACSIIGTRFSRMYLWLSGVSK